MYCFTDGLRNFYVDIEQTCTVSDLRTKIAKAAGEEVKSISIYCSRSGVMGVCSGSCGGFSINDNSLDDRNIHALCKEKIGRTLAHCSCLSFLCKQKEELNASSSSMRCR